MHCHSQEEKDKRKKKKYTKQKRIFAQSLDWFD